MLEIKIILRNRWSPFWATHSEALITDLDKKEGETNKYMYVDKRRIFSYYEDQKMRDTRINRKKETKSSFSTGVITLYSTKSLQGFIDAFNISKHGPIVGYYNPFNNNCADAIQFLLDFFFDANIKNPTFSAYLALKSYGYTGLLGFAATLLLDSPFANLPRDVHHRAKLISLSHGTPEDAARNDAAIVHVPNTSASMLRK